MEFDNWELIKEMLPSKNRLNMSKKFNQAEGKKVLSEEFVLVSYSRPNSFKLAVTVSKKVAPRAVDRNRIKRLVGESLRHQSIYNGELIIIVNKNIANLKKNQVEAKLIKLFKKLI